MMPMKGITCCGDCGYYNWKKHSCTRAKEEGTGKDRFYVDCPLPDVIEKLEPKEPEVETLNEIDRIYRCPTCHKSLFYVKQKYCDQCGQAVKWDG